MAKRKKPALDPSLQRILDEAIRRGVTKLTTGADRQCDKMLACGRRIPDDEPAFPFIRYDVHGETPSWRCLYCLERLWESAERTRHWLDVRD